MNKQKFDKFLMICIMARETIVVAFIMMIIVCSAARFEFEAEELETTERAWDLYGRWMKEHQVSRTESEMLKRFPTFRETAKMVLDFNSKPDQEELYNLTLNGLADMSPDEKSKRCVIIPPNNIVQEMRGEATASSSSTWRRLPTRVDWRARGAVTNVKDQGGCCK